MALRRRLPWTDAKRLSIFATTALILDDAPPLARVGLRALASGNITLDARLVQGFYGLCSRKQKFALVEAVAATRFPAEPFRRLFFDALHRQRPTARERGRLVLALRLHLGPNPSSAGKYRALIRRLLRSREGDDVLHALDLVSRLTHAETDDVALVVAHLRSRNESERMNAVNALAEWTRRPGVSAKVRRFATSEPVVQAVRKLHKADPSPDVRMCATYYVKALRRSKAGRASR